MNNTALQIKNFDFYGDSLIAIQDNATKEIYTSITQILRGLGFTKKQIEHQRKKFINDNVISKGVQKFLGVDLEMPSVNDVWCISNRKLPLALAKISITPKMRREQPETSNKLELYQEKCADVLANVFLDIKPITSEQIYELTLNIQNLISQNKLLSSQNHLLEKKINRMENMIITLIPPTRHSEWKTKVGKKIRSLAEQLGIDSEDEIRSIYGDIYRIMRNDYDMDIDKFKGDYLLNHKEVVNPPAIDIVDEFPELKSLFESVIDNYIEIKSIKTNV